MRRDGWSLLSEHRERLACAFVAVVLALAAYRTATSWRAARPLGAPRGELSPPAVLPQAPFLTGPLAQVWPAGPRDPFKGSGTQTAQRGPAELGAPPLPPIVADRPPPADPWPTLYRDGVVRARPRELTLVTEPKPPTLKSGKPCTIAPRPHDIVQAKGDPGPREGTIRREDKGTLWFYYVKPRGMGHPKNPLVIADLVVLKRKTHTVQEAYRERSAEAGKDTDAHVALAQECIDGDLVAEAEAELRKAIALKPLVRAAYLKLADLHLAQGDRDGEIGALRAAVAAGAESAEVHRRLGLRCFEHGLFGLAYGHFAAGFRTAGRVPIDEVAARQRPAPAEPLARELLRLAAEVRLLEGRLDDAGKMLSSLEVGNPRDPAVCSAQALSCILMRLPDKVDVTLAWVPEGAKLPAGALNTLGVSQYCGLEYDKALAHFDACREAAPSHVRASVNAALAEAAKGNLAEADTRLAAIGHPPAGLLSYALAVGYLRERQGRPDDALAAYERALAIDPASFIALCGAGRCHLARNALGPALGHFAKARLLSASHEDVLRGVGTCLLRSGKTAQAIELFAKLAEPKTAPAHDLARFGIALAHLPERRGDAAAVFARALANPQQPDPFALAGKAYLAYVGVGGTREESAELFGKAKALSATPELAKYTETALRNIRTARREEFTTLRFEGESSIRLPEGWSSEGRGVPMPLIRADALHLEGRAPADTLRQVIRHVAVTAPAGDGLVRTFTRFDAQVAVPITNQAPVGVSLGVGNDVRFQLAVRTVLKPQPTRGLAWRILRGDKPTPWTDLPGPVAVETLKLGLGLGDGGAAIVVLRDGRPVGAPVEFPELRRLGKTIELGLFAAPDAGQECLFSIRAVELVWRKTPAER